MRASPVMTFRRLSLLLPIALIAACSDPLQGGKGAALATRTTDGAQIARGGAVFKIHCATCHGDRAQGAFAWQRPGADGKYPPPPLDGSAHAWHHPKAWLKQTIRKGTQSQGGNMPAWGATLSNDDIEAVIVWFQSLWPAEIYQEWARNDQRSRQ